MVKYCYDAWGNHKVLDGNGNKNTDEDFIGNLNPFRYRSYYYDTETHLYYLNTRYYDPEVGRFISQDDVSYLDPEHVNGLNLFAYCRNNPVMNVDPSGCSAIGTIGTIALIVAAIAINAVIGGLLNGVSAEISGDGFWAGFVGGAVSSAITGAGMALAIATGNVGAGLIIVAVFGAIGNAVGNLIQQSMSINPYKHGIDPIAVVTAGALGALFSMATYGLTMGLTSISYGVFESGSVVEALKLSSESVIFTVFFGILINIIQICIDLIINAVRQDKEKKEKTKRWLL